MADSASAAPALHAALDAPLPVEVVTGAGTAVFVCGWCYSPVASVRRLAIEIGGASADVSAHGMPRLDLLNELRDPLAYRSGFWGTVPIARVAAEQELAVELRAELEDGTVVRARLGQIHVRPTLEIPDVGAVTATLSPPRVAICMATYNPSRELLEVQLDSIRAQTHESWLCLISDDCSSPESFAMLQQAIDGDVRFVLSRAPRRLGFYRNFERALSMAPTDVEYVALADQDDRWHPDKLTTLIEAIGDASLVYSDARLVTPDGAILADTYWSSRRNNHTDLHSLLVANSVTGAASLMRTSLLRDALPFPPAQFAHYHDHWVALVALALGPINYVDRPLYDYVQHGEASLGHATANQMRTLSERLIGLPTRSLRERIRKWRMHYFVDIARLTQFATVLELRCGPRMAADKRRVLDAFLAGERSPVEMGRLLGRGVRELTGTPETLGAEWMLFLALLWRLGLSATAWLPPQSRLRLDAVLPPDLAPGPSRVPVASRPGSAGFSQAGSVGAGAAASIRAIAEKIEPLTFEARDDAPSRVNLLIPTIDLDHLFGGYIAKFNLALALARRGRRVRIVTVDPTPPLPRDWMARLESYSGLAGLHEKVEFVFGRESSTAIEVSDGDTFIATTWWTAHIARRACQAVGGERFLYLIQEYEPFTFPHGTYSALATESYTFAHSALFSTELLRDYFRGRRIGVYVDGLRAGDGNSAAFNNAITAVRRPTVDELRRRASRRLLFYARPEPHAARNLFELGVLAIEEAAYRGCFSDGWELRGIGSVRTRRGFTCAAGSRLSSVGAPVRTRTRSC